jgi:hypothetical protein
MFQAKYILLLTLIDPNSGLHAGCSPVTCIHTINFCKNCCSLVKYARTCPFTYLTLWLPAFFFNIVHRPLPLHARFNKYL